MSLKPLPIGGIPEQAALIARTAFRKGNLYMRLRDELGTLYADEDFAALYSSRGQPGLPAWRLALVTVMQFLEKLSDRQAAEAVRARIDWKYALGLELTDPGFDYSVLSEFRTRLIGGKAQQMLLDRMLEHFKDKGIVKARGRQRTDSTHVLAAIRVMNRLELVAEALRATLNNLVEAAPDWLRSVTPGEWYERYGRRIEESRLPKSEAGRKEYAQTVGQDGFALLDAVIRLDAPAGLTSLPAVDTLRQVWERHYERDEAGRAVWRAGPELSRDLPPFYVPTGLLVSAVSLRSPAGRELLRSQIPQAAVRALLVVPAAPTLDAHPRIHNREKYLLVLSSGLWPFQAV